MAAISYFLTATDHEVSVGKLAIELGNSEKIAKSFYIQSLEPNTGRAWFTIGRQAIKVVAAA